MPKQKTSKFVRLTPWLNQRTLMMGLFFVLMIFVAILISKETTQKAEVTEPTTVEKAADEPPKEL